MTSKLTAVILGLGLSSLPACDPDPDEPGPEGAYEIDAAGGTDDEFPPVTWPERFTVEVVALLDDEREWCSGGECWYGNADVKVDGERPDIAILRMDGEVADLGMVIEPFPLFLEDRSDCSPLAVYASAFDLRLESGLAEGSAMLSAECYIYTPEDEFVESIWADFQWQLWGASVEGDRL
jgi:hypothetical protein